MRPSGCPTGWHFHIYHVACSKGATATGPNRLLAIVSSRTHFSTGVDRSRGPPHPDGNPRSQQVHAPGILRFRDARCILGATLQAAYDLLCFCERDDGEIAEFLTGISLANRNRNELIYYDLAFTVIAAAGVEHLFIFVDQLEDPATTQTKAKRTREVGGCTDRAFCRSNPRRLHHSRPCRHRLGRAVATESVCPATTRKTRPIRRRSWCCVAFRMLSRSGPC